MNIRSLKIASATLLAVFALCAMSMAVIALAGMQDDTVPAEVAIILGNRIEADGQPSARLRARLDRALALHQAGLVTEIIVSGGMGLEGFDEATAMHDYLRREGYDGPITLDHDGVNTWATARNAARIMDERGLTRAYAVSQYFHVPRSKLALSRFGIEEVYGAAPTYFEWRDIYSTFREVVAYVVYWFRSVPETDV